MSLDFDWLCGEIDWDRESVAPPPPGPFSHESSVTREQSRPSSRKTVYWVDIDERWQGTSVQETTCIENRLKPVYCPYTDREIEERETSREHIIPMSLGGVNGFEIAVDSVFNSQVGSSLDGALANEFLVSIRRTRYDARGHSGKEPVATIKRATYGDGRLAHVHFHQEKGIRVWDVKEQKTKQANGPVHIETTVSVDLPVRFTAKVALGAGYYVYDHPFRKHVDHRQLRDVMNIDPAKLDVSKSVGSLGLEHLTLRVDGYFSKPSSGILNVVREFCSSINGSVVVLMPGDGCFGVAVGILGQYVGMVNVPANTVSFPNQGDFRWGHVVAIVGGEIWRSSWMSSLYAWDKRLRKVGSVSV